MSKTHDDSDAPLFDGEIDYGKIRSFGIGLLLVTVVAMAATWWLVVSSRDSERRQDPPPTPLAEVGESWEPPGPRLQEFPPSLDMAALRAWEKEQLSQFAHVDEANGTVRIPIDHAISILAERGLPERGEVDAMASEVFGAVSAPDAAIATSPGAR